MKNTTQCLLISGLTHKVTLLRYTSKIIHLCSLLLAFTATSIAWAQSDESGEVVTLKPFEISESPEGAYNITNTTVGTRSNRDLTEIIQTVNILTQEFLKDINAITLQDSIQYVSNTNIRNSANALAPGDALPDARI
ncbi:MAG: hypothetical protein O3C43_21010 [Verrucomicrobia bacterium]|nr:hypothetical protein [Verrucomicrobiota bacterium]